MVISPELQTAPPTDSYVGDFQQWEDEFQNYLPEVFTPEYLGYEQELRQQTRALVASVALGGAVEVRPVETPDLMTAIKIAEHNSEALEMVKTNVKTDYIERSYKSGHTTSVQLNAENGNLGQHGQSMISVNANSLRFLKDDMLRSRARIETHNAIRQQRYFESGLLEDYTMVTFSLVPDSIQANEAKNLGFFTESMSLAIQAVSSSEDGVRLSSAFVAGADDSKKRFDIGAVKQVAKKFGVDFDDKNTEQILATPLMIHNSMLQDGVIDIVQLYDQAASNITGQPRFYGRAGEKSHNYQEHKQECASREKNAEKVTARTTAKLIVAANKIKTPEDATRMLDNLNDAELKLNIAQDKSIDANVLGSHVVSAVNHARRAFQYGDHQNLARLNSLIAERGNSRSCPTGAPKSDPSELDANGFFGEEQQDDSAPEDCDFVSKECPKCHAKNVPTKCRNGVYIGDCGCRSDKK